MFFSIGDDASAPITLGLLRLVQPIEEVPFFYHVNSHAPYHFQRTDDLEVSTPHFKSVFSVYEGYDPLLQSKVRLIKNACNSICQTQAYTELFHEDTGIKFILNEYPEAEYIVYFPDADGDFSVFLLPRDICFALQEYNLPEEHPLHDILAYYEPK